MDDLLRILYTLARVQHNCSDRWTTVTRRSRIFSLMSSPICMAPLLKGEHKEEV